MLAKIDQAYDSYLFVIPSKSYYFISKAVVVVMKLHEVRHELMHTKKHMSTDCAFDGIQIIRISNNYQKILFNALATHESPLCVLFLENGKYNPQETEKDKSVDLWCLSRSFLRSPIPPSTSWRYEHQPRQGNAASNLS